MLVSGDVDGNGMADFQILLRGSVALQATEFLMKATLSAEATE